MSPIPKIKIILPSGDPDGYICDLEQAGQYLNFGEGVFSVEGQSIHSYEDLVNIACHDEYKDKEYLVIEWLQVIGGG